MWERNLQDLIRGLRAHKNDEARFIAEAIGEIRKEVRSEDMELKAAAVLKLTYVSYCPLTKLVIAYSYHVRAVPLSLRCLDMT